MKTMGKYDFIGTQVPLPREETLYQRKSEEN